MDEASGVAPPEWTEVEPNKKWPKPLALGGLALFLFTTFTNLLGHGSAAMAATYILLAGACVMWGASCAMVLRGWRPSGAIGRISKATVVGISWAIAGIVGIAFLFATVSAIVNPDGISYEDEYEPNRSPCADFTPALDEVDGAALEAGEIIAGADRMAGDYRYAEAKAEFRKATASSNSGIKRVDAAGEDSECLNEDPKRQLLLDATAEYLSAIATAGRSGAICMDEYLDEPTGASSTRECKLFSHDAEVALARGEDWIKARARFLGVQQAPFGCRGD